MIGIKFDRAFNNSAQYNEKLKIENSIMNRIL